MDIGLQKQKVLYRRIVENLRAGVPSPSVASHFPMGRDALLLRVTKDLEAVAAGKAGGLVLQASYGEGKTHVLHAIWDLARKEKCVVTMVALSKETSLDKPDKLYAKLAANTYVPESTQPGLDHLLSDYPPSDRRTQELLAWAEHRLHPKIAVVLKNRIEGSSSLAETLYKLDQDLCGVLIAAADLKSIHRLNFHEALKLPTPFRAKRDMLDYFRLLEYLVRAAGYRAWVILLDEAEMIGSLGRGGRAASYAMLARLLGLGNPFRYVYTVAAIASNFIPEVLQAREEATEAPEWLEVRGRVEEARLARAGIRAIEGAELLPALSDGQLLRVMEEILKAHELAYDWDAGISGAELFEKVRRLASSADVKLRTRIRTAIQWLDLRMQYGGDPLLEVSTLEEENYTEVDEAVDDTEPDDVSTESFIEDDDV